MAHPTFTALCPNCGAAIYGAASGSLLVQCPACQWSGHAQFHFLPNGGQNGSKNKPSGFTPNPGLQTTFPPLPPMSPITITNTLGPDEAPDPLEPRRDALRTRLYRMASAVSDELFMVSDDVWQMPAWRRYERMQEAHGALFDALGGVRMGEYHPARATVDERLASVLLWALLTLDGVDAVER